MYVSDRRSSKRLRQDSSAVQSSVSRRNGLSIARPVRNAQRIHLDAWRLIFSYSDLKFLLEAKTICKAFNTLLKDQSIWRASREALMGLYMPPPPRGMSEQLYANLLVGRGCQMSRCARAKSSKVFWTFRVRLCGDCFRRQTVSEVDLLRYSTPPALLRLLPAAVIAGGRYRHCQAPTSTEESLPTTEKLLYSKREHCQLLEEYWELRAKENPGPSVALWMSRKREEVQVLITELCNIEDWLKVQAANVPNTYSNRRDFFLQKAASLVPPMSSLVLHTMIPHHKAMEANRPANDQVWTALASKILPLRAQAETLVCMIYYRPPVWATELFWRLYRHRIGRKNMPALLQPEQRFIINLAEAAWAECEQSSIPDSTILLLCLQIVFEKYHAIPLRQRPQGLNSDGLEDRYRLTFDDARMIVEEVIEPRIQCPQRHRRVLAHLQCMGCHRKDRARLYTFVAGMQHIFESHVPFVGEDYHYTKMFRPLPNCVGQSGFRFPWYTVDWPRALPLVPEHFEVTRETNWNPDLPIDLKASSPRVPQSAFVGRHAVAIASPAAGDLTANLQLAVKVLRKTNLGSICQTMIAMRYATERSLTVTDQNVNLHTVLLALQTSPHINASFELKYRCGICVRDPDVYRGTLGVKHPIALQRLLVHWQQRHADEEQQIAELLHLPDEFEVMDEILRVDAELRAQQDAVRARELVRSRKAKMKPDAKAHVVLSREFAVDVLDKLFPKD